LPQGYSVASSFEALLINDLFFFFGSFSFFGRIFPPLSLLPSASQAPTPYRVLCKDPDETTEQKKNQERIRQEKKSFGERERRSKRKKGDLKKEKTGRGKNTKTPSKPALMSWQLVAQLFSTLTPHKTGILGK
jgi:hypothetical protein